MYSKQKTTGQAFYYFGLFIYVLSINIQYSFMHNEWAVSQSPALTVLKLMRYAAYGLCILNLMSLCRINVFSIVAGIALFVSAVYASFTGPQKAPLLYFVLLVTGIQTNFRKCVKIFFVIQLTTFILYVTLAQLGISGADVIDDAGRKRCFMGYGWVNRASYSWLFICLEILYLKKGRLNPALGLVLSAVNSFIFYRTRTVFSMSMTFGIIGCGVLHYCWRKLNKKRRRNYQMIYRLSAIFFVVTIIIGLILPLVYSPANPVLYHINKMVTGRLSLAQDALGKYGLHLGGNKLQWVGSSTLMFGLTNENEYFYVDNGFLQMALESGLLFTFLIIFLYISSIKIACVMENMTIVVVLEILGILFVFEPYVIDFAFNPFVLYFFSSITVNTASRKRSVRIDGEATITVTQ